jgi:ubiquinol-cytochrome c reductase cytochrome c1 subunit
MNKVSLIVILSLCSLTVTIEAEAASEGGHLEHAGVNIRDVAAIQRGARIFVNYCLSCHSASYMRYNRLADDLGLDENLVMQSMVFSDAKIGQTMDIAMSARDAEKWFGKAPPDLSTIARSRGTDWLFSYMKTFYHDDAGGWNNLMLPNASMPHVLWQLQGIQKPIYSMVEDQVVIDHLTLVSAGLMTPEEYEETVRDLVTFLDYLSEPAKMKRKNIGIWVMLFLTLFALLTYALKVEYWRDVH